MAFNFRSPLSSVQLTDSQSVSREKTFGTSFGSTMIGGYHEVFSLDDLEYVIPSGVTGSIEFTGNTIPVNYSVKTLPFLPNTLIVNSDGISSGRRRLGMLVYVISEGTTYQYQIPNYTTLWNSADNGSTITSDTYGYTIRDNSTEGAALISAWTGSTIEGVSGVSRSTANWIKYHASAPEYISINAVPASSNILTWLSGNSINDAFITIPSKWEGRQLISVNATYGNSNSQTNATFKLEMRDSTNSVDSSVSWTHTANNRLKSETFGSPLTLKSGHTLNIGITSNPDTNAEGYSASFEIDG